jgi:transcriptional regulator with PAS, ATPase and Fis domain
VNVRVVAATNLDIAEEVRRGRFREDLYYRLMVVPIAVPPLRRRPGDIPLLAASMLEKINAEYGRRVTSVAPEAINVLQDYDWPGNVRELENVLRRAVVSMRIDEATISPAHLPGLSPAESGCADVAAPGGPGGPRHDSAAIEPLEAVVGRAEAEHIRRALAAAGGNRTRCAQALGISIRSLQYKLKRYGITGNAD